MTDYTKFDADNPPPPLMTGEPDSFAHYTFTQRIPDVIEQVLVDHKGQYPAKIVQAVNSLRDEIESKQPVQPLETSAPDGPDWAAYWQPHKGKTWFEIPWFFAEAFFYRRLLEATGYFGSKHKEVNRWQGVDPFLPQKQAELKNDEPWQVLALALDSSDDNTDPSFRAMLHHCVWGNRIDLSYNQVAEESGREISLQKEQANLLVDDAAAVARHIYRHVIIQPPSVRRRIDFICDNAGTELLLDLALADYFLCFNWVQQVTLHVKAHPTFVSDAIPDDVEATVEAIAAKDEPLLVSQLGARLKKHQAEGRLVVRDHLFWNSPKFFWEFPSDIWHELVEAQLVVIKGDANYRRLLGDSRWPTGVPLADAVPYFPTPFVALRTMKSDPVVGLKRGQAKKLEKKDPQWRVNGKRGLVQAYLP